MISDPFWQHALSRRHALAALAAGGSAIPFAARAQERAAPRLLPDANVCVLTPQAIEGPYYFDPKLVRTDITEGRPGVPLGLVLQVVEAGTCAPLQGARVDIWHADAVGVYSGYTEQTDARNVSTVGQHFLRGTQFSDAAGLVKFTTVYPGWYRGRTPHIHCKAFLDSKTVLTGQFYFPDALSEYIYKNVAPYNTRTSERDTANANDMVVRMSGGSRASFLSIKEEADRYLASLILGVDRNAAVSAQAGGPPPGMPPGPPPGGPPPAGARRAASPASLVPGLK